VNKTGPRPVTGFHPHGGESGTRCRGRRLGMNREELSGRWRELRGRVRETWGKITDDDLATIEGQIERLIGVIQKRYGYARAEAEREIDLFLKGTADLDRREPMTSSTPRDPKD
jgi:uncharacterized protein YjbJ (UPF0337 family)